MLEQRADIVICGAGIAGISAAYFLSQTHTDILLVDERPPLSLTSDKSTEAYRNWWPGPDAAMVSLMNRSISLMTDLARQTNNSIRLNHRGYVYTSADANKFDEFLRNAEMASEFGAGPVRIHRGEVGERHYIAGEPSSEMDGVDLIFDQELIRTHYPYLTHEAEAVLHVRRAGWFSGQQLGMHLFQNARENGVRFTSARVVELRGQGKGIEEVVLQNDETTQSVRTRVFLNAAGPSLHEVNQLMGIDLPISWERHTKMSMDDPLGVIPREAPLLIWDDPQVLPWSTKEREILAETADTQSLLGILPPGAHLRPEGDPESGKILMLWPYDLQSVNPTFPITHPSMFPEVVLRGLATMVPGLRRYFNRMPKPFIDGGYYTKTFDNRFLCGPLPLKGAFILGALSGYGLMAACGAGELVAAHINREPLPEYASAFEISRFDDLAYLEKARTWGSYGQL
jgi:sarcosine oxidase subunit beta